MAHIVIDGRPINSSGYGRYLRGLVQNLARLDSQNSYTILTWPDFDSRAMNLPVNFKCVASDYPISGSFREQLGLLRQINKLKPDLVHFGVAQQPVLYRGKKITTIHDLTTVRFKSATRNILVSNLKQFVYGWVIKKVARSSMAIIAPSKFVKKDLARFAGINPAKVGVVYEAADRITARVEPVPRVGDKPFIMYVGRAMPHKNLKRLVGAFEMLKKNSPDLMLVLAGKLDANYKLVEALVSDKRLAHSVVFPGHVSEGQLRWLYENTAAYVFPSLSEGFGLPGLEAMAHGAPVVSSKATCLPEIYGDAAVYFDPLSTNDIARKINSVINSQSLRTQMIKRGRSQAARYSWKTMAKQTLEIYKQALGI